MIDRYRYWTRPLSLHRDMNRLFTDALLRPSTRRTPQSTVGSMNAYHEGDKLVVQVNLPGVEPDKIDVSVQQGILTIRGKLGGQDDRDDRGYVLHEHRSSSFARSLRLPASADIDAAQATFQHGVLRLTFPQQAQPDAHKIPVTIGGHPAITDAPSSPSEASSGPDETTSAGPSATQPSDAAPPPAGPSAEVSPTASSAAEDDEGTARPARSRTSSAKGKTTTRKPAARKPRVPKAGASA